MKLAFDATRVTRWLASIVTLLVLASLGGQFARRVLGRDTLLGLIRLFDLDQEANVPTWYSSMALLLAAGLLVIIARSTWQRGMPDAWHWAGLALIFLALSVDEAAGIHELAVAPLRRVLALRGVLLFGWVVPGGVFVALMGLAYLRFVLRLPPATRQLFVIAGGLYVGGALGLELIGAWVDDHWGRNGLAYLAETTLEETAEMAGIVVFIHALLAHIGRTVGRVELRVNDPGAGP